MRFLALSVLLVSLSVGASEPAKDRTHGLWSDTEGVDASVISLGQEVDVSEHLRDDGFTVVHFGADWCGACVLAERSLRPYLREHQDTALRAVVLSGSTPSESASQPVYSQYLRQVPGLPYLVVFDKNHQALYNGPNVNLAIAAIDEHR